MSRQEVRPTWCIYALLTVKLDVFIAEERR